VHGNENSLRWKIQKACSAVSTIVFPAERITFSFLPLSSEEIRHQQQTEHETKTGIIYLEKSCIISIKSASCKQMLD